MEAPAIEAYWGRDGLSDAITQSILKLNLDLACLTINDIAPLDQFHSGGKSATVRLANLANLRPGMRVLDVGGGLGGPARTLAVEFDCDVDIVDLTDSYVRAGEMLTHLLRLSEKVTHTVANGLSLKFEDASYDVLWTQNSGMNIHDKRELYAGFYRVLRPGGFLVFQEPVSGPVEPPIFPLMWAVEPEQSFLVSPTDLRSIIEQVGFVCRDWVDVTSESSGSVAPAPAHSVQRIVMGDRLLDDIIQASKRNRDENRILMIQAVFIRPAE